MFKLNSADPFSSKGVKLIMSRRTDMLVKCPSSPKLASENDLSDLLGNLSLSEVVIDDA